MSLVSTQQSSSNSIPSTSTPSKGDEAHGKKNSEGTEAALSSLLGAFADTTPNSMERGAPEYSQSGLNTPYPTALNDASEDSSADHPSAANYTAQEVRPANYSTSATPTSEYGVHPSSARSGSFPEHIQRQYYPSSNHSGSSGSMAQPTSPSLPLPDGAPNHRAQQIKSDQDVPIDPSIAASSPTYPPHAGPYSAYPPQQDMSHGYPQHPGGPMYAQPRPDWGAGYSQHPQHGMPAPYSGVNAPNAAAPSGPRPGQVSTYLPLFKSVWRHGVYAHALDNRLVTTSERVEIGDHLLLSLQDTYQRVIRYYENSICYCSQERALTFHCRHLNPFWIMLTARTAPSISGLLFRSHSRRTAA